MRLCLLRDSWYFHFMLSSAWSDLYKNLTLVLLQVEHLAVSRDRHSDRDMSCAATLMFWAQYYVYYLNNL